MKDYTTYKKILEDERNELEAELKKIGVHRPGDLLDWETKKPNLQIMEADKNEAADRSEELQANAGIIEELAVRYNNIIHALARIEEGTYGICEVSGKPIEEDRLKANPAARTCKAHVNEEIT